MAVELVTGYAGTAHVSSSEDGARQAGTVGTGMYVLETVSDPLAATLENANTVTIGAGDILMNGRHVQLTGSTTYSIPVGTQGQMTSNLLVLRYDIADDGTESVEAITLTGEPAASDPQDPALATGSILDGDAPVDMPLYRVVTTGIETAQPERLFGTIPPIDALELTDLRGTLPISMGGTGATNAAGARSALGLGALATIGSPLPVANGGTGMTANPSMLTNLGSGGAAGVFQASPRPGVTGVLGVGNGGTGVTSDAAIGLKAYPIGAVYISWNSTSPASLFGGSWTQISGYFPYFGSGTGTGGSNSQTLDFNHTHPQQLSFSDSYLNANGLAYTQGGTIPYDIVSTNDSAWSGINSGQKVIGSRAVLSTKTISTVPYYQTLYAWRRTA